MLSRLQKPSFFEVQEDGSVASYWNPEVTGKWGEDASTGRFHADTLINYMRQTERPMLLGHVVRDMMKRGEFEGVETGFFHRIAEHVVDT